jgi:pSer/pThr/pTyr-binding forkhead associated (FHA) protein
MGDLVVDLVFKGKVLRTLAFDRPVLRIGRMRENEIAIDNLSVSRFHGRLVLEERRVFYEDAGSENGSFVNDARVHGRVELAPGDRIAIGKHQLRVRTRTAGDVAAPAPPAATEARSDPWDAMQTYFAGPDTQARMRAVSGPEADVPKRPQEPTAMAMDPSPPAETAVEPSGPAAAPAARYAGLIVQRDGRIERVAPWDGDTMVVGRANDCDLVLGQDEVSRRHARFLRVGDRYEVEDLGSVNGTLVNGRRAERHLLNVGDVVQIESFQLTFVLDREPIAGAVQPAPPPTPMATKDHFEVTILQEELSLASEADEEVGSFTHVAVSGEPAPAPAAPLEVDLLAVDGLDEPFGDAPGASIDDLKELASARPRGSSRASSIQDLGAAPAPPSELTLELRIAVAELPEPLRSALAELGASEIVLPGELRVRTG